MTFAPCDYRRAADCLRNMCETANVPSIVITHRFAIAARLEEMASYPDAARSRTTLSSLNLMAPITAYWGLSEPE